jgi:hypothetical protein
MRSRFKTLGFLGISIDKEGGIRLTWAKLQLECEVRLVVDLSGWCRETCDLYHI